MKKPKKISKLKIPRLPKPNLSLELLPLRRTKSPEEKVSDALSNVPRITNETVIDHREEVLSSARKYIYPLQHSKHLVVRNSLWLLGLVIVVWVALRSRQKDRSIEDVKAELLLDRIATAENIDMTEEDLEKEIAAIAQRSGESATAVRANLTRQGALDRMKSKLQSEKTLDWLCRNSRTRTKIEEK